MLRNYTGIVGNCTGCAVKLYRVRYEIVQSVLGNYTGVVGNCTGVLGNYTGVL